MKSVFKLGNFASDLSPASVMRVRLMLSAFKLRSFATDSSPESLICVPGKSKSISLDNLATLARPSSVIGESLRFRYSNCLIYAMCNASASVTKPHSHKDCNVLSFARSASPSPLIRSEALIRSVRIVAHCLGQSACGASPASCFSVPLWFLSGLKAYLLVRLGIEIAKSIIPFR